MSTSEITQAPDSPTLVSNGLVDFRGNAADRKNTGGWKSAFYVIVEETAEKLAYYSIAVTIGNYFITVMHFPLAKSRDTVTNWIGTGNILTLIGAFLADAFLGRFKTIFGGSIIYAGGMLMLTLSATLKGLRPPPGLPATSTQESFLYAALALIAIGMGAIKPCVSTFGADQFDMADPVEAKKKYSFFNWFFVSINLGAILGIGGVNSIANKAGPGWGYGLPAMVALISTVAVAAGYRSYRYQKPMGSPFTRFAQVIVAACRSHKEERKGELYEVRTKESDISGAPKLSHTEQYRFLDKAAVMNDQNSIGTKNRWRLCTVTQVEEFKCVIRLAPIVVTTTALAISFSQLPTYFTSQSTIMNRNLKPIGTIAPGMVTIFATLNPIFVIPIYVRIVVPILRKFTGHPRGITSLQRIGVGLFISIFAMGIAALVEKKRLHHPDPKSMSFVWLAPQVFLMGTAEAFTFVGQLELFYDEASLGTRSICSAVVICQNGVAHFLSTLIVKIIERLTGGTEKGWLRNDLNKSRLDYFYLLLCWINAINLVFYLWAASSYKGRDNGSEKKVEEDSVRDEEGEGSSRGY